MADKENKPMGAKPQDNKQERPQQRRPQQAVSSKPIVSASGKEVKGVVRLAGRDLKGSLPIGRAITSVRGVGITLGTVLSQVAFQQLGMNDKTMVGELSEEEVEKLEKILQHPENYGVPTRMLNRQKDLFTGNDVHLIGSDLAYAVRQDIDHEKESNTWKGYRHTYGQKVRGQRTRSTGRTGMTVGVLRKAVLAKAGAAAQAAQAAGAPGAAPAAGAKGAPAAAPKAGAAPAGKAAPAAAPKAAAPAKKDEAKK
ncbi:MAG: 30S ribosomal protein S13 [Candidatus Anstonellaceae archaeon]